MFFGGKKEYNLETEKNLHNNQIKNSIYIGVI